MYHPHFKRIFLLFSISVSYNTGLCPASGCLLKWDQLYVDVVFVRARANSSHCRANSVFPLQQTATDHQESSRDYYSFQCARAVDKCPAHTGHSLHCAIKRGDSSLYNCPNCQCQLCSGTTSPGDLFLWLTFYHLVLPTSKHLNS